MSQLGVWHIGQQWTAPAYKEPAREGTSIHPISSVPLSPILPPTILTFVFIHSIYISSSFTGMTLKNAGSFPIHCQLVHDSFRSVNETLMLNCLTHTACSMLYYPEQNSDIDLSLYYGDSRGRALSNPKPSSGPMPHALLVCLSPFVAAGMGSLFSGRDWLALAMPRTDIPNARTGCLHANAIRRTRLPG